MLEVCVDSLASANNAIRGGADEIEICSALHAGGLTPSKGLVTEIQVLICKLPLARRPKLNVMLRCNESNDFLYTEEDMQVMLQDLVMFKEMGIDKFVFGALTDSMDVDETNCLRVLAAANPKKVTFSRAFDYVRETRRAASVLAGLGIHRILTSGHQKSLNHIEALPVIEMLATRYINGDELLIMPGGGVNINNVDTFIKMGCPAVHSSCRGSMHMYLTDYLIVHDMKKAINKALEEKELEAREALPKKQN